MKIEPSFCDHWKTKRLHKTCGAEAVLGLLRLWGQAKIKRQYTGLVLNPTRLAAVMEYCGDEDALWRVMTDPAAAWLDEEPNGTWALHGYAEHQSQIIRLWEIGKKGGRPKSDSPPPTPPTSINTSSSTSTSPISEPNGNHMVSEPPVYSTPSLKDWIEQCGMAGIEKGVAEEIWHDNEGRGMDRWGYWLDYRGNPIRNPISNAKSRAVGMTRRSGGSGGQLKGGTSSAPSVWSLKERIAAAQVEIDRIRANPENKEQVDGSWDRRLKAEPAAKVKELKAKIDGWRAQMTEGKEAA
jgi:hypothetical protein